MNNMESLYFTIFNSMLQSIRIYEEGKPADTDNIAGFQVAPSGVLEPWDWDVVDLDRMEGALLELLLEWKVSGHATLIGDKGLEVVRYDLIVEKDKGFMWMREAHISMEYGKPDEEWEVEYEASDLR